MKKIFTLIAMALVAMSADAKLVVDLPEDMGPGKTLELNAWQWRDVKNLFTGAEIAADATDVGVVYFDASAYDYVCIKYKECTMKTKFGIQYESKGTVGQWGAELYGTEIAITANTSGFTAIPLDAAHKSTCYKIYIQPEDAGQIIIEEVYFASTAEYEADLAANPVVPFVKPTKEINMSSATLQESWGFYGIWVVGDFSMYDYVVFEIEDMNVVDWGQWVLFGKNPALFANSGSFVQVIDITEYERNTSGMNFGFQGGSGSTLNFKKVYFATAAYIQENGITSGAIYGDTFGLSLDNLTSGWNANYDAQTKTITIGAEGEDGGKGWWFGEGAAAQDLSHFDNVVIEFEPTTFEGELLVEYSAAAAPGANRAEEVGPGVFGVGATCVVVPLDAAQKSHVKVIQIKGSQGASFTLKAAYAAVASATPEANIGTITGIETVEANALQNTVRYNMAGQKVDDSYKGVVIMNGKKVVMK